MIFIAGCWRAMWPWPPKAVLPRPFSPKVGCRATGHCVIQNLALFSYMVGDYDPQSERDVVFIPVGLNYDRVLEDRILTAAC